MPILYQLFVGFPYKGVLSNNRIKLIIIANQIITEVVRFLRMYNKTIFTSDTEKQILIIWGTITMKGVQEK